MRSTQLKKLATGQFDSRSINTCKFMKISGDSCEGTSPIETGSRSSRTTSTSPKIDLPVNGTEAGDKRHSDMPRRKTSNSLSAQQVSSIFAASKFAEVSGFALNRFVTLAWEHGDVTDPVAATQHFLKLVRDALGKKGVTTAWVWVHECGRIMGLHVHILIHVPPSHGKWFNRRCHGWMKACGATRRKGVRHSRSVGFAAETLINATDHHGYEQNLIRALAYMAKDACPKARQRFGIATNGDHGTVIGKRAGVSQNIGTKARMIVGMPGSGGGPVATTSLSGVKH